MGLVVAGEEVEEEGVEVVEEGEEEAEETEILTPVNHVSPRGTTNQ